ncbi:ATP-grasp domain-containing protein [Lentzea aerocolonigenes]|uniref:ATP-grasp domain-containing protein n=1 Tax=Lentzea aerocolonigenes TaxID=68170 RepID=UPI0004C3FD6E|nr:ATP-grasp domain-containing protein [Lentzea aerocolonigenes]MCP2241854.1 Biotin carboxylase [Lentzea aerocolonigenes]
MKPVIVVGFVGVTIGLLAEFQPDDSVIYVEEPDVIRKRHVREQIEGVGFVRGLIEWEYLIPGKADEFFHTHRDLDPAAVVPAIEYATPFAARLAERYGLPGATLGAAEIMRDKALLRQVTAAAGIRNPASVRVTRPADVLEFMEGRSTLLPPSDREACTPCRSIVLKPSNRQASVGTQVIHDPYDIEAAWAHCTQQDEGIFVPDRPMALSMLAEEFVSGDEFSVEMLVRNGKPLFANVTGKQLVEGTRPVELAHIVPADIPSELDDLLKQQTARVIDATGFRDGIVHCEWIVADDVPHLVECAGRLAGDGILDVIQLAYPVELLRCYYAVLKGEDLPSEMPARAKSGAAVRFLTIEPGVVESVEGVAEARQLDGVHLLQVTVSPGEKFDGLRSSWDRAGIVMATGDTSADALRRAENAAEAVRIEIR